MRRVRIILPVDGDRYLLELFDNPAHPATLGQFRFPGGGVEAGESLVAAVVREAREEFGADFSGKAIRYVGADPRPEFGHEHYFLVADHGVTPGSYDDAAFPGVRVTLFAGVAAGEGYLGPDPSTLRGVLQW